MTTFMFYSNEVLSIKDKTELGLVFFISTTNNKIKRLPKKDIEKLNLESVIYKVRNPPQPFALRLYATLLLGITKIYVMRIEWFESEIKSFFKKVTFPTVESKKIKKRKILGLKNNNILNICQLLESDFESNHFDFLAIQNSGLIGDTPIEEKFNSGNFSNDFVYDDLGHVSIDYNIETPSKKLKRTRILDKKIEISAANEIKALNITTPVLSKTTRYNLNEFAVIKQLNNIFIKVNIKESNESVEQRRRNSSTIILPHSSNTEIKEFYDDFCDFDDHNHLSNEQSYERKVLLWEEKIYTNCIFNEKISNCSKYMKSLNFHRLLELGSSGSIKLQQKKPYGTKEGLPDMRQLNKEQDDADEAYKRQGTDDNPATVPHRDKSCCCPLPANKDIHLQNLNASDTSSNESIDEKFNRNPLAISKKDTVSSTSELKTENSDHEDFEKYLEAAIENMDLDDKIVMKTKNESNDIKMQDSVEHIENLKIVVENIKKLSKQWNILECFMNERQEPRNLIKDYYGHLKIQFYASHYKILKFMVQFFTFKVLELHLNETSVEVRVLDDSKAVEWYKSGHNILINNLESVSEYIKKYKEFVANEKFDMKVFTKEEIKQNILTQTNETPDFENAILKIGSCDEIIGLIQESLSVIFLRILNYCPGTYYLCLSENEIFYFAEKKDIESVGILDNPSLYLNYGRLNEINEEMKLTHIFFDSLGRLFLHEGYGGFMGSL